MSGHLTSSSDFFTITPDDNVELRGIRALYVGGAGNLSLVNYQGVTVPFNNVVAGSQLQVRPRRVRNTGTTATGIVGYR